jgi:hypothetical protein
MKRLSLILLFVALLSISARAQSVEKSVEKIRNFYNEVGKKIEFIEQGGEQGMYGELVCNELTVNKHEHSWPAVGNYKSSYKFFYEFSGDDETKDPNPYPDRLVKIVVHSSMSARSYYQEFLYDKRGSLVFYYLKATEEETPKETRVYFNAGKAIRVISEGKTRDKLTAEDLKTAREVLQKSAQVKELFIKSLKLPDT